MHTTGLCLQFSQAFNKSVFYPGSWIDFFIFEWWKLFSLMHELFLPIKVVLWNTHSHTIGGSSEYACSARWTVVATVPWEQIRFGCIAQWHWSRRPVDSESKWHNRITIFCPDNIENKHFVVWLLCLLVHCYNLSCYYVEIFVLNAWQSNRWLCWGRMRCFTLWNLHYLSFIRNIFHSTFPSSHT